MADGSCHGVRRTKEGPSLQAHKGVEMLMHKAWVTHHRCPLALEQSVTGGAGIMCTIFYFLNDNCPNAKAGRRQELND